MAERLTRAELQAFTEACPAILGVFEGVLGTLFDEQGGRWTDVKLRVGGAMSAVELARNSRLQPRRALWHASMVLMTLRDAVPRTHDASRTLAQLAAIAHTLSLTAIACDSEVASEDSVRQARVFLRALGTATPSLERLLSAHQATFPDEGPGD